MIAREELVRRVTEIVRSTPGVTMLYSAEPVVATILSTVASTAMGAASGRRLVAISDDGSVTTVRIRIGTGHPDRANDVARRVYDGVEGALTGLGLRPESTIVEVEVASVG